MHVSSDGAAETPEDGSQKSQCDKDACSRKQSQQTVKTLQLGKNSNLEWATDCFIFAMS